MNKFFIALGLCLSLFVSSGANAQSRLTIDFSLPEFAKADYRKPYVAIWAETKTDSHNLLLWHLTKAKNDKWLIDIRRWWRKEGRYSDNTFDGVTGATKSHGKHQVELDISKLSKEFTLFIEVVRQKGGRSIVRQKINLNDDKKQFSIAATQELGAVNIKVSK